MSRKFLSDYSKEFKCIVASNDESHARCTACDQQIDLRSKGKNALLFAQSDL